MLNKPFNPGTNKAHQLPAIYSWPASTHQFDEQSVWAVNAALAARRPLLVRGEPGMGKSQLARAAADVLGVPFLYHVIDARCECDDLLYSYDAVSRLAQAQLLGAAKEAGDWKEELAEGRFIQPGPLWWAFNWESAQAQANRYCRGCETPPRPNKKWKPGDGCVVLIDEIDKADSDVPNGLLESLGNIGFRVPLTGQTVALPETGQSPLVVVTTNEERELPSAFLRRCLVLQMNFPEGVAKQIEFLTQRARNHATEEEIGDAVLREAAEQLLKDRKDAEGLGPARPGAAEYLDLVKALVEIARGLEADQLKVLKSIQGFAFRKNPEQRPS